MQTLRWLRCRKALTSVAFLPQGRDSKAYVTEGPSTENARKIRRRQLFGMKCILKTSFLTDIFSIPFFPDLPVEALASHLEHGNPKISMKDFELLKVLGTGGKDHLRSTHLFRERDLVSFSRRPRAIFGLICFR